jgi:hypothetical protein
MTKQSRVQYQSHNCKVGFQIYLENYRVSQLLYLHPDYSNRKALASVLSRSLIVCSWRRLKSLLGRNPDGCTCLPATCFFDASSAISVGQSSQFSVGYICPTSTTTLTPTFLKNYNAAMHSVVAIPEIANMIFQYLKDDAPSLNSLCRTCLEFHVHTISMLWESLPSVTPLMLLLPSDAVEVDYEDSQDGRLVAIVSTTPYPSKAPFIRSTYLQYITSRLRLNDWARFHLYAPYVRKLLVGERIDFNAYDQYSESELSPCDPSLLKADAPLLRNLEHLGWSAKCLTGYLDIGPLCLFLTPSLVSLDLDLANLWFPSDDIRLPKLTETIQRFAPSVIDFALRGPSQGNVRRIITRAITSTSKLYTFHIDQREFETIQEHYPMLSELRSLVLRVYSPRKPYHGIAKFVSPFPGWLSLEEISGDHSRDEIRCFWLPFFPVAGYTIRKLTLDAGSQVNPIDFDRHRQLYSVIGDSCPSLESIEVTGVFFPRYADSAIGTGLIQPLYRCSQLSSLRISSSRVQDDISYALVNNDILHMALAFPRLQTLHLGSSAIHSRVHSRMAQRFPNPSLIPVPSLTLDAIATLIRHSIRLESLLLTINARSVPAQADAESFRPDSYPEA